MTHPSAFQAAALRWCLELPQPSPATVLVPTVTEQDCRLVGAGDGSVMVYCTPCRSCLAPRATTLNAAAGLWEEHTERTHPPVEAPAPVPVPDPWTDPDAAAALTPPPF